MLTYNFFPISDNHRSQHHLDQDEQIRLNLQKYSEYRRLKSLGHNGEAVALLATNEPKMMSANESKYSINWK